MTKEHVETAIKEGIPFLIKMADGKEYKVTDQYQIALGDTRAFVVGKDDVLHLLPMLNMTGISYLKSA